MTFAINKDLISISQLFSDASFARKTFLTACSPPLGPAAIFVQDHALPSGCDPVVAKLVGDNQQRRLLRAIEDPQVP